jgi:hypothetical protein
MAISDEDKRKFRRQAEDLAKIDDTEPIGVETGREVVAWMNEIRAKDGTPPLELTDADEEDRPELEFYRRARALGMVRRSR